MNSLATFLRVVAAGLSLGVLLSACVKGGDSAPAATSSPTAPDPEKGEALFQQCRACHSLEAGGANRVGPNLHGVFGRKAGLAPGFNYSEAMARSNIVWSPETLSQWLAQPSALVPGTAMMYAGIRAPQDRANLIAYLKRETGAR